MLSLHHGQVSGALSNLHRKGHVFMLRQKRDRCHPYVHWSHVEQYDPVDRIDEPTQTFANQRRNVERLILDEILRDCSLDLLITNGALAEAIAEYRRMNDA